MINITTLFHTIIDKIFPPKCLNCTNFISTNMLICHECWNDLTFCNKNNICAICSDSLGKNLTFNDKNIKCKKCYNNPPCFDKIISIFEYNKIAKELIHKFKFNDSPELVNFFSPIIRNVIENFCKENNIIFDIITDVPINFQRIIYRKYNQSSLLASKLSKNLQIPYISLLHKKTSNYKPQSSLKNKIDRENSILDSFYINKKYANMIVDKNIIIIDDVVSTGVTLNELAKILKEYGAKSVYCLVIARNYLK
jgi:competence protein ComFC